LLEKDPSRFQNKTLTTQTDIEYRLALHNYFVKSNGSIVEKLENFPKYVSSTTIARFLSKYEIFKHILNTQGSIIECGVLHGGGLMTWAQLSAVLEPMNHQRKIIGFDTFSGFPSIAKEDAAPTTSELVNTGGLAVDSFQDLEECIRIYDMYRPLSHIWKVKLVKGDAKDTIPQFIRDNPHIVVSLLYLDFDIFEPTSIALDYFFDRIPRGGVIAFDQLNSESFPGETVAAIKKLGIGNLRIQRPLLSTSISYAVME
jgi:hypothetical protein